MIFGRTFKNSWRPSRGDGSMKDIKGESSPDPEELEDSYGSEKTAEEADTEKKEPADGYRFMNQVIKKKPRNWKKFFRRLGVIAACGAAAGIVAAIVFALAAPFFMRVFGVQTDDGRIIIRSADAGDSAYAEGNGDSSDSVISSGVSGDAGQTGQTEAEYRPSGSESGTSENISEDGGSSASDGTPHESAGSSSSSDMPETGGSKNTDSSSGDQGPSAEKEPDSEDFHDNNSSSASDSASDSAADGNAEDKSPDSDEGVLTLDEYRDLYREMLAAASDADRSLVEVRGITNELDYFDQNYENSRQSSGMILARNSESVFIVTAYGVIEGAESIQVTFDDGTTADGTFLRSDPETGICVITVEQQQLDSSTKRQIRTAPLGSSYSVEKGEPVLALGSPMGYSDAVAFGFVTSVSHKLSVEDNEYSLLTTDIEGRSGGGGILVDLDGKVVGIVLQSDSDGAIAGIGISQITDLLEKLSNNDEITYAGVTGQTVTADISERTGMPGGVLVTGVGEDSPAMLAGIKEYDVITDISGTEIRTVEAFHGVISSLKRGDVVTVTAMRRGAEGYSEVKFSMTVGSR